MLQRVVLWEAVNAVASLPRLARLRHKEHGETHRTFKDSSYFGK